MLAQPDASWDRIAYTMIAKDNRPAGLAVSSERFRYLENVDGSVELFDVQADPREWRNLTGVSAHAADLAAMKKLATDYKAKFRRTP